MHFRFYNIVILSIFLKYILLGIYLLIIFPDMHCVTFSREAIGQDFHIHEDF